MMKSARTSIKNPARKPRPKPAPSSPSESPAPADPTDSFVPYPLFPPIVLLTDHQGLERPINNHVRARLGTLDPALEAFQTWRLGIDFLAKQCQRPEFTPRHYKIMCPVLETMLHWFGTSRYMNGKKRMLGSSCTSSCAYLCHGFRGLAERVTC